MAFKTVDLVRLELEVEFEQRVRRGGGDLVAVDLLEPDIPGRPDEPLLGPADVRQQLDRVAGQEHRVVRGEHPDPADALAGGELELGRLAAPRVLVAAVDRPELVRAGDEGVLDLLRRAERDHPDPLLVHVEPHEPRRLHDVRRLRLHVGVQLPTVPGEAGRLVEGERDFRLDQRDVDVDLVHHRLVVDVGERLVIDVAPVDRAERVFPLFERAALGQEGRVAAGVEDGFADPLLAVVEDHRARRHRTRGELAARHDRSVDELRHVHAVPVEIAGVRRRGARRGGGLQSRGRRLDRTARRRRRPGGAEQLALRADDRRRDCPGIRERAHPVLVELQRGRDDDVRRLGVRRAAREVRVHVRQRPRDARRRQAVFVGVVVALHAFVVDLDLLRDHVDPHEPVDRLEVRLGGRLVGVVLLLEQPHPFRRDLVRRRRGRRVVRADPPERDPEVLAAGVEDDGPADRREAGRPLDQVLREALRRAKRKVFDRLRGDRRVRAEVDGDDLVRAERELGDRERRRPRVVQVRRAEQVARGRPAIAVRDRHGRIDPAEVLAADNEECDGSRRVRRLRVGGGYVRREFDRAIVVDSRRRIQRDARLVRIVGGGRHCGRRVHHSVFRQRPDRGEGIDVRGGVDREELAPFQYLHE